MKKLPLIALVAGVVAWAVTRGKKHEEPEAESQYAAETPLMAAVSDTSPSGG